MSSNVQPAVSVIVPVFNGARYIRGAVESILAQTFKDFEIIVVDDGSTDNTKAVLEPWINEGKIRYVYQQNKGLAGARNTGIRHAKGKYFKFLDCDDYLYPEQLERQVEHLKDKPQNVISSTDYELEFESKNKKSINLYLRDYQLGQFIEGNPCPVHTILVQRSLVEQAGGFDETLSSHEDSDLWLRILLLGGVFERTGYVGCCYRLTGGALSADTNKMFIHYCKFSEKLNQALMLQFKQLPEEALRQLYFRNIQSIHKCFAQGIKPASCLLVTLKATRGLYTMKANYVGKLFLSVMGIEHIAQKEYGRACKLDPKYPKKLLDTAWRDERFYMRKGLGYLEVVPRNKNIKNILYLNSSAVMYGAETRLLDIIRNLDKDKFRPLVLLPHAGPLDDRLKELGVFTVHLEYGYLLDNITKENIIRFLKLNREFVRIVRRYDIDLIHANLHINLTNFWLGLLIVQKPVIVHMRSHFKLRKSERLVINRAFKAICISKFVEQAFLKKDKFSFLMFERPGHTEIVHDGIDVKYFFPRQSDSVRKELKISPQEFLVGIIGAVDKIKGQDLLIKAANIIVKKHPNTKFIIVGDLYHNGKSNLAYRDGLLKLIKDFHLDTNVIFTGSRNDINFLMNEIDLLVQPSEREALGTSMVEAMSCGKPVIGTDVDGIPEVIGNNEAGILLNPREPEAFAEAINLFIENPEEIRKRGAQGRERVLRLFNIYSNIKRIEALYREALSNQW